MNMQLALVLLVLVAMTTSMEIRNRIDYEDRYDDEIEPMRDPRPGCVRCATFFGSADYDCCSPKKCGPRGGCHG